MPDTPSCGSSWLSTRPDVCDIDRRVQPRQSHGVTTDEIDRFYADFGRRVRAARERRGLTQQQLAAGLGLTRSSVANVEAGRQRALLHTAVAIAGAAGVPTNDLVPDHTPPTARPSIARDLKRLADTDRKAVELLLLQAPNGTPLGDKVRTQE